MTVPESICLKCLIFRDLSDDKLMETFRSNGEQEPHRN